MCFFFVVFFKSMHHVCTLQSDDVAWISERFLPLCNQPAFFMERALGSTRVVQSKQTVQQVFHSDNLNKCGSWTADCSGCFGWKHRRGVISSWRHLDYWDTFVFSPLLLLFHFGVCGYCGHSLGGMFSILERLCGFKMMPYSKECNIDFGQTASQKIKK